MKSILSWSLLFVIAVLTGCVEQNTTVTIRSDGSSVAVIENFQPREMLEQQIRMREQSKLNEELADADDEDDEATPPKQPAAAAEPKPLTDAELIAKLKEMYEEQAGNQYRVTDSTIDGIAIKDGKVRTLTTLKFANLTDFVSSSAMLWSQYGFSQLIIDAPTTGQVRLTFRNPQTQAAAHYRRMTKSLRTTGARGQIKFVLPGKIVSSSLPVTQDNSTSFAIDPAQEASYTTLANLQASNIVIVAEAGGLQLAGPLDSAKLRSRAGSRAAAIPDVPVTDAGPGFQTEAISITAATYYVFPEAQKNLHEYMTYGRQNQLQVQAKLFSPKGRTLLGVAETTVTKAVDDQGRNLMLTPQSGSEVDPSEVYFSQVFGGNQRSASLNFQVPLRLPEPDVKAIAEITGEIIATTVGNWKEQSIADLTAAPEKLTDLTTLIPGAKLAITKFTQKNRQVQIACTITGPAAIRHLDFKLTVPGAEHVGDNAHLSRDTTTGKGEQLTRNINLTCFVYSPRGGADPTPSALVVRLPDDLKRERVKFTLQTLDLY